VYSCGKDPLGVAEYLKIKSGGNVGTIRHRLSAVLRTPDPFVSSALIDLTNLRLSVIYTTNFDELLEETFRLLGIQTDTICNARDLALARGTRPRSVDKVAVVEDKTQSFFRLALWQEAA
jgi:hypothetical protein